MARQLRIEYEGAFYHIIQRGNEKKDIFLSEEERGKFYEYLEAAYHRYGIKIHTYCLMNNHYHLILETKDANLIKAMHFLNTCYTVFFNTKNKRSGHLFQGRYKAILVEADNYLHHLSRYIHLNPLRVKMVGSPIDYPYSSYKYFVSDIAPPYWLETSFILKMFDKSIKKAKFLYKEFVTDFIGKEQEIIRNSMTAGFLLGSQNFVEKIKKGFIRNKVDKEIPAVNELKLRPTLDRIREAVKKNITSEKLSRTIEIYLTRKYANNSLKEIASLYNKISDAGVSALYYRIDRKRLKDKTFDKKINEIEKMLKIET